MKSDFDLKNILEWAIILGAGYVVFRAWQAGSIAELAAPQPMPEVPAIPESRQLPAAPLSSSEIANAPIETLATQPAQPPQVQPSRNVANSDFFKLRMAMPSKWGAN